MSAFNFESMVPEPILERGYEYYIEGQVKKVEEIEEGHFMAHVQGSESYVVHVFTRNHDLQSSTCTCPYDMGPICKHEVAVFFTLRRDDQSVRNDLLQVLHTLNKEDLIKIIQKQAIEHPELERVIFLQYGEDSFDNQDAATLIRSYFDRASDDGYIPWDAMDLATKGAELVLEKAWSQLNEGNVEQAINLALTIVAETLGVIYWCEDEDAELTVVIDDAFEILEEAIHHPSVQQSPEKQQDIFNQLLQEATHSRYDEWGDWGRGLLHLCANVCESSESRQRLNEVIDEWLSQLPAGSFYSQYSEENLKSIQLDLLERYEPQSYDDFLKANLHLSKFRERLIQLEIEKENYKEALHLCEEGEEQDQELRGLVMMWKEYRYTIYGYLKDIESRKALGEELLLGGYPSYYAKIKMLYSEHEWQEALSRILQMLRLRSRSSMVLQILIDERLTEELLEHAQGDPESIGQVYPYIIEEYPEQVADIFAERIYHKASQANGRSQYRNVCRTIQEFQKACGKDKPSRVIDGLEKKYPRRTALQDELRKVK